MATYSSILAWRIPMERRVLWATVHRVTKSWTWLKRQHAHMHIMFNIGIIVSFYSHQNWPLLEARRKENADDSQCLWLFWWKQVACICRDGHWLDAGPHINLMMTSSRRLIAFLPLLCCVHPDLCYLFTGTRTSHSVPGAWSPPPPHAARFTLQLPLPRPSPISYLQHVSKLWFFQ